MNTDISLVAIHVYLFIRISLGVFSLENNPKNLKDPSYKMDLDFWHCLGRDQNLYYSKFS